MPEGILYYVILGIVALVFSVAFFFVGSAARKNKAEKAIGSAEEESRRILSPLIC